MSNIIHHIPNPVNEPILPYGPGSKEKLAVKKELAALKSKELEVLMTINGKRIKTDVRKRIFPPHELNHTLGYYYKEVRRRSMMPYRRLWLQRKPGK